VLVRRHVGDDVHVARDQLSRASGRLGDDAPDDRVEVAFTQGELVPLLEQDVVVLHPLDELVRAGADRVSLGFFQAHRLVRVLAVDADFGDQAQRD